MNDRPRFKRRHYFINKEFQTLFAVKFLIVLIIAAVAAMGLYLYHTAGTITIGYDGSEINLDQTNNFFLQTVILSIIGLIVFSGIIAVTLMIFISHKIVGPLFNIEKNLAEISWGDLTIRIQLRGRDQFETLADEINQMTSVMDAKFSVVKNQVADLSRLIDEISPNQGIQLPVPEMRRRLSELQSAANYFTTSSEL
jgi:methyl-accepting chemotaxis protein